MYRLLACLLLVLGLADPAGALEYGLQVANLYREGSTHYFDGSLVEPRQGIAAVVGENSNPSFVDWVYLVIQHPPRPGTFKVVVGWERRRGADRSNLEGGALRQ